jgi:C-terminal processing protease CtpA/Prc
MTKPRLLWLFVWLAIASSANAQALTRQNVANILGFENNTRPGVFPAGGWFANPGDQIVTDDQIVHSGRFSARFERTGSTGAAASVMTAILPLDFAGRTIEWRGYLKWQTVSSYVALWMRVDGPNGSLAFASMQSLNLNGTRDWGQYSISVPNVAAGTRVFFGFILGGNGQAWVDDLELLVDGIPVARAAPRVLTVLDTDHEFDQGSRITLGSISSEQTRNLATLAKVWGFLKYHHPAVIAGLHHWDYDLFRILPKILDAADRPSANAVMLDWVRSLGNVEPCRPCATLDSSDLYLAPDLGWLRDETLLGAELSESLQSIYRNRPLVARQFYISMAAGIGNPVFDNEPNYSSVRFPDSGYQLLALFRYWNMVQYFYPNRDIMADDPAQAPKYWNDVLEQSIAPFATGADVLSYLLELSRLTGKIHDTHANGGTLPRPPLGTCQLPVDVRFVENKLLVLRHISITAGPASGLLPGDVIESVDGKTIEDLVTQWRPFFADSNEAVLMRDISYSLTRGNCGPATVVVRRAGNSATIESNRVLRSTLDYSSTYVHDRPGPAFQILPNDIAYLKLSAVSAAASAGYIRSAAATKGLIIDIRNYPSEFVVFTLGQLLVSQPTQFVNFAKGDVTNPGAFRWTPGAALVPQEPRYTGKIVILVDEQTQSQAEYTTMAFRTASGAIVIGSTTAGADGDVSLIPLPGGLSGYFSGNGVFYPDKRPTQRVGILPDIEVRPTLDGIRAGRDEVLEEAIRQIEARPSPTFTFSMKDRSAVSFTTSGSSAGLSTGYATVQPEGSNKASGLAIITLRQNSIVVSETAVPAAPLIRSGRTYAEINATVNTGLAIANPGNQNAMISFYFTNAGGNSPQATVTIPAKGQIAAFLDQTPFNRPSPFTGTLTFTSSVPVAVIALRGLTNSRAEFLMTTLPVADLNAPQSSAPLVLPHYADGGGWTTQILLANPSETTLAGTVQFLDASGKQTSGGLRYSIAPRGSQKLQTAGSGSSAIAGSVRVVPDDMSLAPFAVAVFSFRNGVTTVSEAGVPAVPPGNTFDLYAQASGDFRANAIASAQTGIAITNTSDSTATVSLELFKSDGSSTGLAKTLSIAANGHMASFLNEIPEFRSLQAPFQGTLRVASATSISAIGFRRRYNERREFVATTLAPFNPSTSATYFPHIADSVGYTTQFILSGPSAGTLSLFTPSGSPLNVIFR